MCIVLNTRAGGHYFGRSYERDFDSGERIVFTPRNYRFDFLNGEAVEHHDSLIGTALMANDVPVYYEAANESGLCMAAVGFRNHAEYFDEPEEGRINLCSFEVIAYVLCHCKNLSEGTDVLCRTRILGGNITKKLKTYPVRWMISDGTGSFVVEPTGEGTKIYPDIPEILTDGPPFLQLMGSLGNYIHLTRRIPKNRLPEELQIHHHEKGCGALGLPGDYSAISRFIRGCFVKYNHCSDDRLCMMFHILSSVEVPKGCVEVSGNRYEYTRYESCIDTDAFRFYYRTYGNSQIVCIDARRLDGDSGTPRCFERITSEEIFMQN